MKRKYPEGPVLGVVAVVFADEAVLPVRRDQDPGKGQWSLPGGVVELGETLLGALERELWEEVSIKIETGGLIGVFERIIRDTENRVRYHYVLADYWGWIVLGYPTPGSDISDARLVPLEEFETLEIDRELKHTIRKAVGMRNKRIDHL